MSDELKKLLKQQESLWLLSDKSESDSEIKELYDQVNDQFNELMDSADKSFSSLDYLSFCLKCINTFNKNLLHNIEYNFIKMWSKSQKEGVINDDTEKQLLETLKKHKITNVYEFQLLADNFLNDEHYDKAIMYYESLTEHNSNQGLYAKYADCYEKKNDYVNASKTLQAALVKFPNSQYLGSNLGYYLYRCKKNNDALNQFEEVINYAEKDKYTFDKFYIYCLKFKATIYRELNMPLQAFIEYSRLSTAGNSDGSELVESANSLIPDIEGLSYE